MFTMTVEDALARQAAQVEHYGPRYPGGTEALREKVRSMTTAHVLQWGKQYPTTTINKHVPRGGAIEALLGIDGSD